MKFKKYNANPKNNKKASDCVFRAISTGLNKSWLEVYDSLCAIGRELANSPSSIDCIVQYLESCNLKTITTKAEKGKTRLKVKDLKNGNYIVKVANHFTCVKDDVLLDTWDCREKAAYRYWKVE